MSNDYENISSLFKIVFVLSGCSSYTMNTEYEPFSSIEDQARELELDEEENQIQDIDDYDEEDFENIFVNEYLPKFKNTIESSSSLIQSFLLTWIIRSVLIQVIDKTFYLSKLLWLIFKQNIKRLKLNQLK